MSKGRATVGFLFLLILLTPRLTTADPTKDAVKGKRIRDRIEIFVGTDAKQKPVLLYRVDGEKVNDKLALPKEFTGGLVFVADDEIRIAFPGFNPLDVQVTASVVETDDPAHTALTQLLRSLTGVAGVLRPDLADKLKIALDPNTLRTSGVSEPCMPLREAQHHLRQLVDALHPSALTARELRGSIAQWKEDIKTRGYDGVVKTTEALAKLTKATPDAIRTAKSQLESFDKAVQAAREKEVWPSPGCRADTLAVYDLAHLADPSERVRELETIEASIKKLAEALAPFLASMDWPEDPDKTRRTWIVSRIKVNEAKSKQVTVKVGAVGLSVAEDSGITPRPTGEATAAFSLRQHRRLIPEIGVGAIIADLRRPKYVVGKNDTGASVVARGASEDVPLSAAVMSNLVWRTDLGIGAPMLQLGGLPSKDAPGLFAGAGLRFFARFGIGAGIVRWWAKDLPVDKNDPTLLAVGKPVASQKDIEDKLKWVGRNAFYVTLQYSF